MPLLFQNENEGYLGCFHNDGLWRTGDGGESWEKSDAVPSDMLVMDLEHNRGESAMLVCGIYTASSTDKNFLYEYDLIENETAVFLSSSDDAFASDSSIKACGSVSGIGSTIIVDSLKSMEAVISSDTGASWTKGVIA